MALPTSPISPPSRRLVLPNEFSLCKRQVGGSILPSRSHIMRDNEGRTPPFCVSHHRGYTGRKTKADVTLHAGEDEKSAAAASARFRAMDQAFTVALHHPTAPPSSSLVDESVDDVKVQYHPGFPQGSYTFTAGPDASGSNLDEDEDEDEEVVFNWIHSGGPLVRGLRGDHQGWVLYRQKVAAAEPKYGGGGFFSRGPGLEQQQAADAAVSPAGKAVFAWAEDQASSERVAAFSFLGGAAGREGEDDGKVMKDERLRLVVVMSGLALFERCRRQNRMGIGGVRAPGAPGLFGNFGL